MLERSLSDRDNLTCHVSNTKLFRMSAHHQHIQDVVCAFVLLSEVPFEWQRARDIGGIQLVPWQILIPICLFLATYVRYGMLMIGIYALRNVVPLL
jgi:hypothetical protein